MAAVVVPAGASSSGGGTPSDPVATGTQAELKKAELTRATQTTAQLRLTPGEKLVLRSITADPDGTEFVRYDRTFRGLPVVGGDLIVRRAESGAITDVSYNATGKAAVKSIEPTLSQAAALAKGSKSADFKATSNKGALVVFVTPSKPVLAYEVVTSGIKADQTPSVLHTFVDATSGAVLGQDDEIKTGTGNSMYSGTVGIGTSGGSGNFSMSDPARGGNYTTDLNSATSGTGTTYTDPDDTWGSGTTANRQTAGVDAHYGAQLTWDYYKYVHGRNGIFNDGRGARSRTHYGNAYVNAFWDGIQMTYGDGSGSARPLTSIDVAGHEMTHGVTEATANLNYFGDAGGLNEATSDIFGTAVEFSANNASDPGDYLIGEKININGNGTPLRYMDKPSKDGRSVDCWSTSTGGLDPHYSSGPLNHWFYLASEGTGSKVIGGVTHSSTSCNGTTIAGLGRDVVAKIWYRALTIGLHSASTYADARVAAIAAAKYYYGGGSAQCRGIAAAFDAINVAGADSCSDWAYWAAGTNVKPVSGDFDADGKADLALTGGTNWNTQPVAFSKGNGDYTVSNRPIAGGWPAWAADPAVSTVSGDFNKDGKADLALSGGPGWATQPVAFGKGDGTFTVSNQPIPGDWARWAEDPTVETVAGDFNKDGFADLALSGSPGWTTQPVAFGKGDGTFTVSNLPLPGDWPAWAADPAVSTVSGDFNKDGFADLALSGSPGWTTQPVAFGKGDGTFTVSNLPLPGDWPAWAADPAVSTVSGDFNADGYADLALSGGPGWASQPVAFGKGDGTFTVSNLPIPGDWPSWAQHPDVETVPGDYNGDRKSDLALLGGPDWGSQPVASSTGSGSFTITNHQIS
nr:M4 family metallopeptidase [Streptomyces sp. SID13031]